FLLPKQVPADWATPRKVAGAGVDPAAPRVWASVGSRPSLQGEVLGSAPERWNDGDSNSDLYRARVVFSQLKQSSQKAVRQAGVAPAPARISDEGGGAAP